MIDGWVLCLLLNCIILVGEGGLLMFVWFGSCWLVIFGNVSCLLVLCSLELCGCFDEEGVCIVVVIVVFVYGGDVV